MQGNSGVGRFFVGPIAVIGLAWVVEVGPCHGKFGGVAHCLFIEPVNTTSRGDACAAYRIGPS